MEIFDYFKRTMKLSNLLLLSLGVFAQKKGITDNQTAFKESEILDPCWKPKLLSKSRKKDSEICIKKLGRFECPSKKTTASTVLAIPRFPSKWDSFLILPDSPWIFFLRIATWLPSVLPEWAVNIWCCPWNNARFFQWRDEKECSVLRIYSFLC